MDPLPSVKSVELITAEGPGDLSGAIRTEIEEDDRIPFPYHRKWFAVFHDHGRFDKFIGHFSCIGMLHCFYRICFFNTFSIDQ